MLANITGIRKNGHQNNKEMVRGKWNNAQLIETIRY